MSSSGCGGNGKGGGDYGYTVFLLKTELSWGFGNDTSSRGFKHGIYD